MPLAYALYLPGFLFCLSDLRGCVGTRNQTGALSRRPRVSRKVPHFQTSYQELLLPNGRSGRYAVQPFLAGIKKGFKSKQSQEGACPFQYFLTETFCTRFLFNFFRSYVESLVTTFTRCILMEKQQLFQSSLRWPMLRTTGWLKRLKASSEGQCN